jgi:hypothetical protein
MIYLMQMSGVYFSTYSHTKLLLPKMKAVMGATEVRKNYCTCMCKYGGI